MISSNEPMASVGASGSLSSATGSSAGRGEAAAEERDEPRGASKRGVKLCDVLDALEAELAAPPLPEARAVVEPPSPSERINFVGALADRRHRRYAPAPSRRAATGRPEACTSPTPLSSICQVRDSTRIDNCAANSRPRLRSASDSDTSSATEGTTFTRVTKWVNSARSLRITPGVGADVVLLAQLGQRGGDVAFHQMLEQIDHPHAVGEAEHLPHVFGAHRTRRVGQWP